jgi:hypothetical protein
MTNVEGRINESYRFMIIKLSNDRAKRLPSFDLRQSSFVIQESFVIPQVPLSIPTTQPLSTMDKADCVGSNSGVVQ